MKRIIALFLAVVLLLSLVGCATTTTETAPAAKESDAAPTVETESSKQNNSGEATTIKIALYAPITGNNAQYGLAYQKTIQALCQKINEDGGIDGRDVVVDVYDDKADQKEALNIANLIVSDPEVVAVVGSQTSSPTLAAAPIFEKAGLPMITPNASHMDITPIGKHIFSISCLSDFEGGQTALKMAEDGFKKVAIIYSNDDNGVYNNEIWQRLSKESNLDVVATENFIPGSTTDFTPLLSKIKVAGAEAMLAIGRALMARPKIMMLDEPSLGLAPLIISNIFDLFASIRDMGVTIILVEQNARIALKVADRGYVIESGSVVLEDTASNLLKSESVIKAYLS